MAQSRPEQKGVKPAVRTRSSFRFRAGHLYLLLVAIFLYLPFLPIGVASLSADRYIRFPPSAWSFKWYLDIPAKYLSAGANSVVVALVATALACAIGTLAALAIHKASGRGEIWLSVLQAPLQVPMLVIGVMLLQFYTFLDHLTGLTLTGSFLGLTLSHAVFGVPYVVGSVYTVLQRSDPRLEEAAATLGASDWSIFRRVSLPLMQPGVIAGGFYALILSFGNIPVSLFLVSPKYDLLPIVVFHVMEFDFDPYVLSVSTFIVLFSILLVFAIDRLVGLDSLARSGSSH